MKKQYPILILIIAALAAYLVFNPENRVNYTLPELPVIKKDVITGIELTGSRDPVQFSRHSGSWVMTEEKYAADEAKIDKMLDVIRNLDTTALVSETKDSNRYHLDEKQRIHVTARSGTGVEREFFIGKNAPTGSHTFISLADEPAVFHARGSFRSHFDKPVSEYRDKTVLKVDESGIKEMTIEKDGRIITLTQKEAEPEASAESQPEESSWTAADGTEPDPEFVDSIASLLSLVKCDRFFSADKKVAAMDEPPLFTVTVNQDTSLTVYPEEESLYPATSSQSRDAFFLSRRDAENFISDIDKILGITNNDASSGNNSTGEEQ